jgi:hypothetical protein
MKRDNGGEIEEYPLLWVPSVVRVNEDIDFTALVDITKLRCGLSGTTSISSRKSASDTTRDADRAAFTTTPPCT